MFVLVEMLLKVLSVLFVFGTVTGGNVCQSRNYETGIVCVCSETYCDTVDKFEPVPTGSYVSYTSDKSGLRFEQESGLLESSNETPECLITINPSITYQTLIGFGGAFTDSTGINVNGLSVGAQTAFLKSYYSEQGLEYTFGRVPIGGTDFSTHGYSYDDGEEDPDLINWKLTQEDYEYKIPLILKAKEIASGDFDLFASTWTAPKWMKTNGEYTGGFLKHEFYQTWAEYHLKFLKAYEELGINFWGISTGNEPSLALTPWVGINTVGWLPKNMSNYIADHFGPLIKSNYPEMKIVTLDDQRFFLPWWVKDVLVDKPAHQYIDGIALHWYWDKVVPTVVLEETHKLIPENFMLATESCRGDKGWESPVSLGDWSRGEDYAHGIIEDLNHWVTGWIDWNLALDETGGPCYIGNQVDATIIVNATAGEFYKQPTYYVMGHFSKFLPKGSTRVGLETDGTLQTVAFKRLDGGIAVVVFNKHDFDVATTIGEIEKGFINTVVKAKSINTYIYY